MKTRISKAKGFTLIELLVVMTIIAILAGAIFAAAGYAVQRARTVQAQNIAVGLVQGVNNFQREYSRWPVQAPGRYGTATGGSEVTFSEELMTNLLGLEGSSRNTRRINFIDNMPPASGTPPAGGLDFNTREVMDPWTNPYWVILADPDTGLLENPEGGDPLRIRVAAFSPGADRTATGVNPSGVDATRDNVRTW